MGHLIWHFTFTHVYIVGDPPEFGPLSLIKTNPDYDILIKRLHLYYHIKLVAFGIARNSFLGTV